MIVPITTYQIVAPPATHWRPATCEEIECEHYQNGWRVRVEGLSERDIYAIRQSGRHFTEMRVTEGETWFVFPSGQPCFRQFTGGMKFDANRHHRIQIRPEVYLARDGKGSRSPVRYRFDRPEQWRDDFAENQERLADRIKRG